MNFQPLSSKIQGTDFKQEGFEMGRYLVLIAAFMLLAGPAHACKVMVRPFEVSFKEAEIAFVGTVRTVENRLAIIRAEKGIKGIEDGQEIDVEIGESSCAIRFQPGQRWLYLGAGVPSGSLLLRDEYGREIPENMELARKTAGDIGDGDIAGGTVQNGCGPIGRPAFTIVLDNGVSATVNEPLPQNAGGELSSFPVGGAYAARGSVLHCPVLPAGEVENLPCQSMTGRVFIGAVDENTVSGLIETEEGEHHSRHVFKVKREFRRILCR